MTQPDPTEHAPVSRRQRVSLEGTIATASAVSACIVAVASMFTAVQALDVSQAAARQRIFEQQLSVCLQFGELTSRAVADTEKNIDRVAGPLDDAGVAEIEAAFASSAEFSRQMHQQYLQMTMLLPEDVADAAYKTIEKRTEIYNAQIEIYNAGEITPAALAALTALGGQEQDLLNEASTACSGYVSDKAGIKE
ncbi:hypothetical protein [Brevundimonas aurifodinae]|uniref:Uncharacterized protein n=2 Tax=Brevundimonas TaxID=41275 RepID=A0ABV1NKG7_9CAUL|nr:MAG: hypothetical protein B7Z42_04100 [Brevundimonas sp. 12-68-7]OYX31385.1 MAG: hypothetical protein B7Z01_12595 [Brevundimonas subvibrioides]